MKVMEIVGRLMRPLAYGLPADDPSENSGQGTPLPNDPQEQGEQEPAEGTPTVPDPTPTEQAELDLAAQLEAANKRIEELAQKASDEAIEARAYDLLQEYIPEVAEGQGPQQVQAPPVVQEREPEEELSVDERLDRFEHELRRRDDEQQIEREMQQLQGELGNLEGKYPHMSRKEVLMIVAQAGGRPLNIEKIAESSHNAHLRELEEYHRSKMQELQTSAPPPTPDPRQSAGPPDNSNPVKTYGDAKKLLAERLRTAGWGR